MPIFCVLRMEVTKTDFQNAANLSNTNGTRQHKRSLKKYITKNIKSIAKNEHRFSKLRLKKEVRHQTALLHSKSSFLFCFAAAKLCFFHFCPPTFRKLMFHFEYAKTRRVAIGFSRFHDVSYFVQILLAYLHCLSAVFAVNLPFSS